MNLRPFTVARFGVWAALIIAALSLLLSHNAGMAADLAAARALFIFVVFSALAFGAEAVLLTAARSTPQPTPQSTADEAAAESTTGVEDAA